MSQQVSVTWAASDHSLKALRSMKERALRFALIAEGSGRDICLEAESVLPLALFYYVKEPSVINDTMVLLL